MALLCCARYCKIRPSKKCSTKVVHHEHQSWGGGKVFGLQVQRDAFWRTGVGKNKTTKSWGGLGGGMIGFGGVGGARKAATRRATATLRRAYSPRRNAATTGSHGAMRESRIGMGSSTPRKNILIMDDSDIAAWRSPPKDSICNTTYYYIKMQSDSMVSTTARAQGKPQNLDRLSTPQNVDHLLITPPS